MIHESPELRAFEKDYAKQAHADQTMTEALSRISALWQLARRLNPAFPGDWREDIRPDLAVARGVNGLPPDA